MEPRKLLQALREADAAGEERVLAAGPLLVWSLRGTTWHPLLSEALAGQPSLLLVTARALPEGPVEEEVRGCRAPLPAPPAGGAEGEAPGLAGLTAATEYALLEQRLHTVEPAVARRLLAELTRARLTLSAPVLVAVGGKERAAASDERAPARQTVYLGLRTCGSAEEDAENEPLRGNAPVPRLRLAETLHITRPALPREAEVRIGDLLRRCRGAAQRARVELAARFELPLLGLAAAAVPAAARPELRAGPFVLLELTYSTTFGRAVEAPLSQVVPAVLGGGSAVVHIRCGSSSEDCLLARELSDLAALGRLHRAVDPDAGGAEADGEASGPLASEAEAEEAVAALLEEEAAAGAGGSRPTGGADEAGRPSRDFVDRLWLRLLSRCASPEVLTFALGTVLTELGRPGGVVPFVRRSSATEAAALFRLAVEASTLRRYAAPGEAQRLEALELRWSERCHHFSAPRHAVELAIGIGVEFLMCDFLHIITRQGSVTARDVAPLTEVDEEAGRGGAAPASLAARWPPPLAQLRCLRHVAELAELASRHYVCADTLRRLVLQAVEFYQRPENAEGLTAPLFTAPLSRASCGRLLSSFAAGAPSSFSVRCGGAFVRVERWHRRRPLAALDGGSVDDPMEDDEGSDEAPKVGLWRFPLELPAAGEGAEELAPTTRWLDYSVTVVDQFRL